MYVTEQRKVVPGGATSPLPGSPLLYLLFLGSEDTALPV